MAHSNHQGRCLSRIQRSLHPAKTGEVRAVIIIHHHISAVLSIRAQRAAGLPFSYLTYCAQVATANTNPFLQSISDRFLEKLTFILAKGACLTPPKSHVLQSLGTLQASQCELCVQCALHTLYFTTCAAPPLAALSAE